MAQILIFGDVTNVHGFGREAGAVKIASVLRASGYKCQVVDYFSDFTFSELQTVLDLYVTTETLWVGFSTTHFAQAMPAERLLELESKANTRVFEFSRECKYFPFDDQFMEEVFAEIRRRNPNCRIVVGGFKAGYTQDFPGVDYWVVGDGEGAALALTASLVGTNTSLKTSPAKSGQILNGNHDYPCIQEFPNFGMLWDGSDHLQSNEFLPVEIARGCSFRCRFCNYSLTGNGQILRNMDSLRDEFLRNYEMYSIKGYLFVDHMVNDSVAKLRDLCEMISRLPFEIEWSGFLRLDLIHKYPEMRDLLLGSGLRSAQFGIETLNPKALKAIGKGLAPEKLIRTLQFLRETWKDRVVMGTGLIVGLPDDSWESIDETIDFFLDPDAPIDSVIVSPLSIRKYDQKWTSFQSFSEYSLHPRKYGFTMTPDGWESDIFTRTNTVEYVRRLYASSRFRQKKRFADYHGYSRIRSLGFSHHEIYNKSISDVEFIRQVSQRKGVAVNHYKQQILNGHATPQVRTPSMSRGSG